MKTFPHQFRTGEQDELRGMGVLPWAPWCTAQMVGLDKVPEAGDTEHGVGRDERHQLCV